MEQITKASIIAGGVNVLLSLTLLKATLTIATALKSFGMAFVITYFAIVVASKWR